MPEYLAPGVFIEETSFRSKSIEGVPTSTAAFIGVAPFGPVGAPVKISSWDEFERTFGDPDNPEAGPFMEGFYLAHAVYGFFRNGGTLCYIVRDRADGTGIDALSRIHEITMVCAPDIMSLPDDDQRASLQGEMIRHCEARGDRMAIVDAPGDMRPDQVLEWRDKLPTSASQFCTLYYPWLEVTDPVDDRPVMVPPCGHVAGVWSRVDSARGVYKAPANEAVVSAIGLAFQVTESEQAALNARGVNCIRAFPGRGIRVWGARTMSNDSEWKYINVRRLLTFVSESIHKGTRWAVFEPNDATLWTQLRAAATEFLTRVWRDGALQGATPDEAFYVKCDAGTNPPELVEARQVTIEGGIAVLRPAEFIVFRVTHFQPGSEG